MSTQQRQPSGSAGAVTAAAIVIVISVLSTFTLSDPDSSTATGGNEASSAGEYEEGQDGDGYLLVNEPELTDSTEDSQSAGSGGTATRRARGGTSSAATQGSSSGGTGGGAGSVGGSAGAGGAISAGGGTGGGGGGTATNVPKGASTADCSKGQNAGANTDIGVGAKEIRFAATVVQTGIAKSFLADAQFGIEAVRRKVNRAGGVCGRLITIKYDDDGWDPATGQRIIEKYISDKQYFGLAVNPSSEGLLFPIKSGLIRNNKFPVVGADGQLIGQYKDPWVWPVATSTLSVMHVIANAAMDDGAKSFGLVWENNYRFGKEGSDAFVGAVTRRLGADAIKANTSIKGGETSYKTPGVQNFLGGCGAKFDKCDFVGLLLEPSTAAQWVRDGGLGNGTDRPAKGIGAPQPLFVKSFARDCGKFCANMQVWTSFKPPIPPFLGESAVATYRNDLETVSRAADASNPHVQGAYVGMTLLVKALEKLGPAPTRAGLKQVLDSFTLDSGLAPPLTFTADNHFAATGAQAFEAIYQAGSFVEWRYTNSGFKQDAEFRKDHPGDS